MNTHTSKFVNTDKINHDVLTNSRQYMSICKRQSFIKQIMVNDESLVLPEGRPVVNMHIANNENTDM